MQLRKLAASQGALRVSVCGAGEPWLKPEAHVSRSGSVRRQLKL